MVNSYARTCGCAYEIALDEAAGRVQVITIRPCEVHQVAMVMRVIGSWVQWQQLEEAEAKASAEWLEGLFGHVEQVRG